MSSTSQPAQLDAPARWELELPAEPASVPQIRRGVTAFVRSHAADDVVVGAVALAVTEAATNAVLHAFLGRPPGRVTVVAEPGSACLVVRVIDDGTGMAPRSDSPGLGVGLPTIAQLTESCDIRVGRGGRGTEVRMVFRAPGVAAPVAARLEEDWRLELLAEVGASTASAWPGEGVQRLVRLLVPRVADACAVDLLEGEEQPRRLAARVDGPDAEGLSAWLAARRPRQDQLAALLPGLRAGEIGILELDDATVAALAHDDADAGVMNRLRFALWVVVPLLERDQLLGIIGLGLGADRPDPGGDLAFWRALGDRAARGLANTRLIDELRRTHRRLERILGALGEAVTVQDAAGRMVYANDAAARLLGAASVEEVLSASPGELAERFLITREDGQPVQLEDLPGYRLLSGEPAPPLLTRSVHRTTGSAHWLLTKATMLDDDGVLVVNIIEDVTEAKDAERRQRFLAEAGELLASTLDYQHILRQVATLAVPTIADWCAVDVLDDDGQLERLALAHIDPEKVELATRVAQEYPPDRSSDIGLGGVLRGGDAQLYDVITDEMLTAGAADERHLAMLREVGMRSAMLVPMRVKGRTIGALSFVSAESGRVFGESDLQLASDLARRAALAVETARLFAAGR